MTHGLELRGREVLQGRGECREEGKGEKKNGTTVIS